MTIQFLCAQSCSNLCNPCTLACQALLSMEFSRQEYWNGLPFSAPRDFPDPGIELTSFSPLSTHILATITKRNLKYYQSQ